MEALAAYLQVPVQTIYRWRDKRSGPAAFKIGKHLLGTLPVPRKPAALRPPRPEMTGRVDKVELYKLEG
ncbi:helix-turn-helix domain-containing protein [Diaminobutyricibacter sp. McL0618]|uniref:helix-turn-helix domain-containing protein n=1 Tax=Leifsonia sp. McL0618 TaxID=3415677 RepID=UPI003CEC2A3D